MIPLETRAFDHVFAPVKQGTHKTWAGLKPRTTVRKLRIANMWLAKNRRMKVVQQLFTGSLAWRGTLDSFYLKADRCRQIKATVRTSARNGTARINTWIRLVSHLEKARIRIAKHGRVAWCSAMNCIYSGRRSLANSTCDDPRATNAIKLKERCAHRTCYSCWAFVCHTFESRKICDIGQEAQKSGRMQPKIGLRSVAKTRLRQHRHCMRSTE